jgi:hypothetical protein
MLLLLLHVAGRTDPLLASAIARRIAVADLPAAFTMVSGLSQ